MEKWKIIVEEVFKEKVLNHDKHCYTVFYLYMCICNNKKLRNRNLEDLEKIIFLSQCYQLEKNHHSMLDYKTYIYDGNVYFKYLSDLFRVMPLKEINSRPFGSHMKRGRIFEYNKILNKYSRLSKEELDLQFKQALENNHIDNTYIVNEKCEYTIMRLLARHAAWSEEHMTTMLKTILSWLVFSFVVSWIIYFIAIFLQPLGIHLGILNIDIVQFIVFSILTIPTWIIWTYRIMKPTKYEIENGFVPNSKGS